MPVLEARGIVKTLGVGRAERRMLDGVSLDVDAGEVVAVLGRSGSGKSTLLHLLGGLDRPDAGTIMLAGQGITEQRPRALARTRLRHVGFVFQSFHLIEELSGEENVLLPARLPGALRGGEQRARQLIGELGLSEIAGRRPHELSGGEQQRLAIARALVNDPELVLADEPTGNLDQENGATVLALLRKLTRRAVVIVTHEPEAAAIADRVLHLRDGRLAAEDAPDQGVRLTAAFAEAVRGMRTRRRRSLLTGLGIALAAAMLVAALVVSDSLGFGFDRAARASDLPDIIVRFNPQNTGRVAQRIAALPDIAAYTVRTEVTNVGLEAGDESAGNGSVEVVGQGRRGYAIVAGRDVTGPGQVVVERGLAAAWHLELGGTLDIDGLGAERIVGFSESPDNVSYPLAVPRVYISQRGVDPLAANLAEIWLRDPRNLDEVLVQARATSYGVQGLRFVTRAGVRVLLDQAAGIVIDLLVALSLIALATASVMLAASARAEVQRRLGAIGVRRAVGASRAHLAGTQALEALFVAAPAATIGAVGGALATYGPTGRLLVLLNEPAPGAALAPALVVAWLASVAIPVIAAAWPAWRAAGRPPVALLRGAELGRGPRRPARLGAPRAGLTVLGARLVGARRTRLIATVAALGFSTGFVLLMLALASALSSLETDPGALGKRYQLTADLPASAVSHVRSVPGVQAVAPRYEEEAVDSYSLGETIDVIAYPGNHTVFEAPPLVAGARLKGAHEAEVGLGLAQALGLVAGVDARDRAGVGDRAAAAGRRRGQLARSRRSRRLRARGRAAGRGPVGGPG